MARLTGSVGQGGDNREADVRLVQQLLNRHDLAPLAPQAEDGQASPALATAIRHFQTRHLSMPSPDGRVDPGGRTLRALDGATGERGTGSSVETRQADGELRAKLVDPRVQETGVTTRLIDRILPDLAKIRARVISGYLSDADQFWKVNFHWESLLLALEDSLQLDLDRDVLDALRDLRSGLLGCAPDPKCGYSTSPIGRPEDRSGAEAALRRHAVLAQAKREFRVLLDRHGIKKKSRRSARSLDLAAAPVARPGTSKHGSGRALDIEGDNAAIAQTCKALGATLVFNEQSHVHVEFANG